MISPRSLLDVSSNQLAFNSYIKPLVNIESLLALYFSMFIFGFTTQEGYLFYNEYRAVQIILLIVIGFIASIYQRRTISKGELVFFSLLMIGSIFWGQPTIIITEFLLIYLLYLSFTFLKYRQLASKLLVVLSLTLFIQFPFALWDYVSTGYYAAIWYPLEWNIRVYDSYFLLVSIFAVWFYLTNQSYRHLYLLFLFLALLAILLDGGRSATIAYTVLITIVSIGYSSVRWQLIATYLTSWLSYLSLSYFASFNNGDTTLAVVRESSSGRVDIWMNALQCWSRDPIIGCGFYQLERYPNLPAHPHNLYVQVLSETGLAGFGLLTYIVILVFKRIDWTQTYGYFIMAAFLAIGVESFFSGVHIYAVTQLLLLWLLVFLLKNPAFNNAQRLPLQSSKISKRAIPVVLYTATSIWFIILLMTTEVFSSLVPFTPPRFWVYGYQL